ncbi:sensor histidine kinase, partial [Chloroflexota bacterium]
GYLNLKTKVVSDLVSTEETVKALNELNDIRKVVQDTYEDIRESIDQLSTEIRNMPLIPTMANYIHEFGSNNGLKTEFHYSRPFPELSPVAELQVLRIAQESMTNVRRHSQAQEVEVRLEKSGEAVELIVKDNGQGFSLEELEESPPGYHGINIIKERAESLGGNLNISTAPGEGTALMVSLPFEKVRL